MDPNKLWPELANGHLWLILGSAAIFGAIGSLLHPPPSPMDTADAPIPPVEKPGRWWVALSGAVAAVALLYVTNPTTGSALIGGSLVAGFSANAVLAGLQARLVAAIATRNAAASARVASGLKRESDANAQLAEQRAREAMQAARDLDQLARAAESGTDIASLVRELRAKHAFTANAPV